MQAVDLTLAHNFSGNHLSAQGAILDRLRDRLRELVADSITLPTKEQVLKIAGDAYDRYVAPIDIPGVPNFVEPEFDLMAKALFLRAVSAVYDSITRA